MLAGWLAGHALTHRDGVWIAPPCCRTRAPASQPSEEKEEGKHATELQGVAHEQCTHARTRDIGQFGGQSEAGAEARDRLDEMRPPSHSSSNADDGPGTTTTTTTMTAMTVAGSGSTTSTGRKKERQGRPNKGERRKKETKKERKKEREKKGKKTATSDPASPPRQISIRHQQIAARRADGWR